MNPLYILGGGAFLVAAIVAWTCFVVIPHQRFERRLKAEGRCIDCECKLPEGDAGPRCGTCWGEDFPA